MIGARRLRFVMAGDAGSGSVPCGMSMLVVPLVGPFHRRFPRYNAVTVLEGLKAAEPATILTSAVPPGGFADPAWRDVEEPALDPVVTWASRRGVAVEGVGEPSPDPAAQADFARYLQDSERAVPALAAVREAESELADLLGSALDLSRIHDALLPVLAKLHEARLEAFGDGPGSDWMEERADRMMEHLAASKVDGAALLVPVDHWASLTSRLDATGVAWHPLREVAPSEEARVRALLDVALAGESDEPAALLEALAEVQTPEARLAEAEVLLRFGEVEEALARVRTASTMDFVEPAWLPGWLLARLGQLADVTGARDEALRAYRGALALTWVPSVAREAAEAGLQEPFTLPSAEGDA